MQISSTAMRRSGQGVVAAGVNYRTSRATPSAAHPSRRQQPGRVTTDQRDTFSGPYCTDIAKMVDARSSTSTVTIPRQSPGGRLAPSIADSRTTVAIDLVTASSANNRPTRHVPQRSYSRIVKRKPVMPKYAAPPHEGSLEARPRRALQRPSQTAG